MLQFSCRFAFLSLARRSRQYYLSLSTFCHQVLFVASKCWQQKVDGDFLPTSTPVWTRLKCATLCGLKWANCDFVANRCVPVPVVQNAVADGDSAVQGSVIHYSCIEGFVPPSTLSPMFTECDGVMWTPAQLGLPGCEGTDSFWVKCILSSIFSICKSMTNQVKSSSLSCNP